MLKKVLSLLLLIIITFIFLEEAFARGRGGSYRITGGRVRVKGHLKKDGTYVSPHFKTAPDRTPYNNYSFPGNYNPYTGKVAPGNQDTYLNNYNKKRYSIPRSGSINRIPVSNTPKNIISIQPTNIDYNHNINNFFGERNIIPVKPKETNSLDDLFK
jgi:hypothetical protein